MWVKELAVVIKIRFVFFVPFLENAAIPHLVPDNVDGEVVLQLTVLAFLLTALVLGKGYKGVAENIGRVLDGAGDVDRVLDGAVCIQQSLSATEDFSCEVAGIDIHFCITIHNGKTSSSEDVAPNLW